MEHIALTRPRVIVLEQVSSILQKKHEKVWNFILKTLRSLNYDFVYKVMNTRELAVPQSRPRVYLLAVVQEVGQGTLALPEKLPKYEQLLGKQLWLKGFVLDVGAKPKLAACGEERSTLSD
jgi:site-specific DNA-cytosine methylase